MQTFVVNGKFMADRMQGIVRYGREILNCLDVILTKDIHVILAIPVNAKEVPNYKNIEIVMLGTKSGILWEQFDLGSYMRKHKSYTLINFCNVTPFFIQPGITVVHDIMYKTFPDNYKSLRNRLSRAWHCLQYRYVFKHEKQIITVSEFSRSEIIKSFPVAKNKIVVIPNGWQHVLKYSENQDWQEKYSCLKAGEFFFSLATLAKNKNGKWIIEIAMKNPKFMFAMGGKIYEEDLKELPQNVKLLGFVSDDDACSLMKNCRAFLFPSLYEKFGIPPLEALAQGADVISSNTSSMPEVLGKSVYYVDPYDYDVSIESLLKENVDPKEIALSKYGWDKSAAQLLDVIRNVKEN